MIKAMGARVAATTYVNSCHSKHNSSTLNYRRVKTGSLVNGCKLFRQERLYWVQRRLIKC
eukprot:9627108-Karenia_brevis.AAC.1